VWESRYGIIQPKRTETNIRYYLDEDLQLVLNIALLNKNGLKISKIAKMSRQDIAQRVEEIAEDHEGNENLIDVMTLAMLELDEPRFSKIAENYNAKRGFEKTMLELIYPFLEKLSVLWLTGSVKPIHENFITHLIRQKVMRATDELPTSMPDKNKQFFLYLPPGEKQELSLLFMNYLLKKEKFSVIYLGSETSMIDLQQAYEVQQPDFIFTIISETFTKDPIQHYVNALSNTFKDSQILLTGYQIVAQGVSAPENVSLFYSLGEMLNFLKEIKI